MHGGRKAAPFTHRLKARRTPVIFLVWSEKSWCVQRISLSETIFRGNAERFLQCWIQNLSTYNPPSQHTHKVSSRRFNPADVTRVVRQWHVKQGQCCFSEKLGWLKPWKIWRCLLWFFWINKKLKPARWHPFKMGKVGCATPTNGVLQGIKLLNPHSEVQK